MPRPLPVDYLQEGEQPLYQEGRHPLSVLDEVLAALILAALPITAVMILAVGFVPDLFWPLAVPVTAAVLLLLLVFIIARIWRVQTSWYTITAERTYKAYGRLRFFLSQTTYDKLTDIHVKQSLFGRIWGFGTVRLETAGTGIAFDGVRDPFGTKQRVEDARFSFLKTLIGEAPAGTEVSAPEPDRPVDTTPIWEGRPTPTAFLSNLILGPLLLMAALGGGVLGGAFVGLEATLVPILMGGVGAFMLLGAWVQLRYTRYLVARRGVVVTSGWLTRRRVETTYEKVTDVTVYQGLLGRIFGFGNITVNTAGSNAAPVVFQGVPRPEHVKQIIDETRGNK